MKYERLGYMKHVVLETRLDGMSNFGRGLDARHST